MRTTPWQSRARSDPGHNGWARSQRAWNETAGFSQNHRNGSTRGAVTDPLIPRGIPHSPSGQAETAEITSRTGNLSAGSHLTDQSAHPIIFTDFAPPA